jgi:hypothetical protein
VPRWRYLLAGLIRQVADRLEPQPATAVAQR